MLEAIYIPRPQTVFIKIAYSKLRSLAEAFNDLSKFVRSQMRPLVSSKIRIINHTLLLGPRLVHHKDALQTALTELENESKNTLEAQEFKGWTAVDNEEMEFMIDLMDTLF